MPPKTDLEYGDTSFTSVPPDLLEAARGLASRQNVYLYELYGDAIRELNIRVQAGNKIEWPVSRPRPAKGGYHTRLEIGALDSLRDGVAKCQVKANIFFIAALRDYLHKHGIEVEV